MSKGFRIELKGADKLLTQLAKYDQKILKEVSAEVGATAKEIENDAANRAPKDEGLLHTGIRTDQIESKKTAVVWQIGVFAPYAAYIEFGTGKKVDVPSGWEEQASKAKNLPKGTWSEFIDNITDWVKRKGLVGTYSVKAGQKGQQRRTDRGATKQSQDDYARQIAFLIARNIYKNGLTPRPFLRPAFEGKKDLLIQRIKNILKDTTL